MPAKENHNEIASDRKNDHQEQEAKKGTSKRRGRPPKSKEEKYRPTHIFFHPKIIEWAKAEGEKRGMGYQSVINEALLEMITS